MNKELLQAAITFFRDQHGTYDAMKNQMLSGGIPVSEIDEIYSEIKRLNLDPSLPGFKQSIPSLQSVTATSTPLATPTPIAPASRPATSTPQSAPVTPNTPPPQPINNTQTLQDTQTPVTQPLQTPQPVAQEVVTPQTPQQSSATTTTNTTSKSKSVAVLCVFIFLLISMGAVGFAIYDASSIPAKAIQSMSSAFGLGDDILASLRPQSTPQAVPKPAAQATTTKEAERGNMTLGATVPTTTQVTPPKINTPVQIDSSLSAETRNKDLEMLQKIQSQCLTRYGNVQFCFDGNAYVVKKIVQNYDTLKTKTFAEKTKAIESISSKAVSGSDTAIISTTPEGTLVNGRPILISINTLIAPATCTDVKTNQTIAIPVASSNIQLCNPKPDVLTNITCVTYTNILNICANGIQKNGTYNSNDDLQVQALLKKYTDALFSEEPQATDSTLVPKQ